MDLTHETLVGFHPPVMSLLCLHLNKFLRIEHQIQISFINSKQLFKQNKIKIKIKTRKHLTPNPYLRIFKIVGTILVLVPHHPLYHKIWLEYPLVGVQMGLRPQISCHPQAA